MMATLEVSNKDAHDAYEGKDHLKLIDAGLTPGNLPQKRPDVDVSITDNGKRATIRYNMNLSLVASDEDELEDVEDLIAGVLQDAASNGLNTAGVPSSPLAIIRMTMSTIKRIRDIWKVDHRIAKLEVNHLPIKILNRQGRKVRVRSKVFVDASWLANDPTEWGSYAWIEREMFRYQGIAPQFGSVLPDDLDDLARANGIVPWQPRNGSDLVGRFYSDLHTSVHIVDRDNLDLTVDVSCNAISDDDVVALIIRSMTIQIELIDEEGELEGIMEGDETGTANDGSDDEEDPEGEGNTRERGTKKPAKEPRELKKRVRKNSARELSKAKAVRKRRTDR